MKLNHYLTCQDPECENVACVGRREFESEILRLNNEIKLLQNLLDKARLLVDQANKRAERAP